MKTVLFFEKGQVMKNSVKDWSWANTFRKHMAWTIVLSWMTQDTIMLLVDSRLMPCMTFWKEFCIILSKRCWKFLSLISGSSAWKKWTVELPLLTMATTMIQTNLHQSKEIDFYPMIIVWNSMVSTLLDYYILYFANGIRNLLGPFEI